MLSSDGKNKSFDAAADGYVRGEGAGALVIIPLGKQNMRLIGCWLRDFCHKCLISYDLNRVGGTNGCGRAL